MTEHSRSASSTKLRVSRTRWIIAAFALALASILGVVLFCLIADPGLGDGVHRIDPAHTLFLLPSLSYGLVAVLALWLPQRDRVEVAAGISLLLLLPIILMGFTLNVAAGFTVAALLGLPLLGFWTLLYRLAPPRMLL